MYPPFLGILGPRASFLGLTGAGLFVEISATARAKPPAVLAAMRRDGKLHKQGLARFLSHVQMPAVMELHIVAALEFLLLESLSRACPLSEDLERYIQR